MRCLRMLLLVALTSCGHMNVQVDVLDRAYAEREAAAEAVGREDALLRRLYAQIVLDQDAPGFTALEELEARNRDARRKIIEAYKIAIGDPATEPQERQFLQTLVVPGLEATLTLQGALDRVYAQQRAEMRQGNQAILEQAVATPVQPEKPVDPSMARLLRERLQLQRKFVNEQTQEIERELGLAVEKDLRPLRAQQALDAASSQATAMQSVGRSLTGGLTLTESPYAHIVVGAKEEYWHPDFNHVTGNALFGNADIAIKLQHHADFTLKGMSFDPSRVAEMARKASIQGLLIATQIAGVPVGLRDGADANANTGLTGTGSRIEAIHTKLALREARYADQERALHAIADAILDHAAELDSGKPAKEQLAVIKEGVAGRFAANKGRLLLDDLSTTKAGGTQGGGS